MKQLVCIVHLTCCLGCNLASVDDLEAVRARQVEQQERFDRLEERMSRLEDAKPRPDGEPPTPMDPDLKRRLDEVSVDVLEKVVESEKMEETMNNLGDLLNESIKDMAKEK